MCPLSVGGGGGGGGVTTGIDRRSGCVHCQWRGDYRD